jgi:transposase
MNALDMLSVLKIIDKYDPEIRRRKQSNKDALLAIDKVLRSGMPWRNLFLQNGTWSTIFKRYSKWCKMNLFEIIWTDLLGQYSMSQL